MTRRHASSLGLATAIVLAATAYASPAERACARSACRPQKQECAQAFRDAKRAELTACQQLATNAIRSACRKNARHAARDGIRSCRTSAQVCSACCRTTGDPCPVAVCGNGRVEGAETCDGAAHGACPDACAPDCTCEPVPPVCGNATLEEGEQCDGVADDACPDRCRDDCTCEPPTCGNGILDLDEECDGGLGFPCAFGCSSECTCNPPICGDGLLNGDEQCDGEQSSACPGLCLDDCTCPTPVCGNGIVEAGEDCETENHSTCGDFGCTSECTCITSICGDGQVTGEEQCEAEPGYDWSCPGLCQGDCSCPPPVCGNDVVEFDEECEPGLEPLQCETGCLPDCRCAYCGDGIIDAPIENCEPDDDAACPGLCGEHSCTCLPPPTDTCEAPREIDAFPFVDRQGTLPATTSPSDPDILCAQYNPGDPREISGDPHEHSVWYALTAPATGLVTADTDGSDYDTLLVAYTGTCEAPAALTCNDDAVFYTYQSRIAFPIVQGERYLIEAAAFDQFGAGELHFAADFRPCGDGVLDPGEECDPGLPETCTMGACSPVCECLGIAADECVDAPVVTELPVDVRLATHTTTGTASDPLTCGRQPPQPPASTWFRFVAPQDGTVEIATVGSDYDTVLALFTGECGASQFVACNDDDTGLASAITRDVSAGATYTVVVTPWFKTLPGRLVLTIDYLTP